VKQPDDEPTTMTTLKIELPEDVPPSEEELARLKEVIERIHRRREALGSIDIRTDDLLHMARAESYE